MATTTQGHEFHEDPEALACESWSPAMKEMKESDVIANFIQHSLKDSHKDVLPSLLYELSPSHLLPPSLSQEELSASLQAMVKERRMSCFQFAKFLLRSKATRPFIFDFTEHSGVPIRFVFKDVLMRFLGADFHTLGLTMNLPKTVMDDIRDMPNSSLRMKIDTFLSKYQFPSFAKDEETAEFLVEALVKASLSDIATAVKKDLEHKLHIKEIGSTACYRPNQRPRMDEVFNVVGASVSTESVSHVSSSAEAVHDHSPHQQGYEGRLQETWNERQLRSEDGIFHGVGASASLEAVHDHSPRQQGFEGHWQETWDERQLIRRQSSTHAQAKHLSTGLPDLGPECGIRNEELPVIPVSQYDEGYEVFAVFDGSKSEDDILQTISSAIYSDVCLARQEDNKQLVHFAAERGYANVLMILHGAGHDITAKMENGQTPFMLAHEAGHTDIVKFLLTCDRNIVNTKDYETGDTDNQDNGLMSAMDCDATLEASSAPFSQATQSEPNHQQEVVTEDVAEDAGQQDEVCLQNLCYMPTGIKKFLISPIGGTITLGNDASLMVSPGTVAEETLVHYAILLHGSIIFPPGYELASVIVYLNLDGVRLMKPVSLFLSHWCIKKDGDGEDTLKVFRASHTLDVEQQKYVFEEQKKEDSDFTTHINAGVLTIWRSQCLYCVARNRTTTARYSAITFSKYIQSEDTLFFRIQFTCGSLTWNKAVTHLLQCKNWKKAGINDAVAQFQFTDSQQAITARPGRRMGPGWEAAIEGHQAIVEDNFRPPGGKSASEIEEEITSGHFPPCIYYTIVYTSPKDLRVKPGMMIVDVDGANVPLSFSCRVQEEKSPTLRMSPTSCGAVSATPSPPLTIDAEYILNFFRVDFIKLTDANTILHELRHKRIISDGDLTEIKRNSDAQQQNEILHRCLKRSCDEEALMEVCGMMIHVDGNRKMNALGQKMKCKLEGN